MKRMIGLRLHLSAAEGCSGEARKGTRRTCHARQPLCVRHRSSFFEQHAPSSSVCLCICNHEEAMLSAALLIYGIYGYCAGTLREASGRQKSPSCERISLYNPTARLGKGPGLMVARPRSGGAGSGGSTRSAVTPQARERPLSKGSSNERLASKSRGSGSNSW